ncbi:unnamed protein product [Phaeothamnion confervicola]
MDQALRSVDVHPKLVPEAVKLTMVRLVADEAIGDEPAPEAYRAAAEIVGYCMIGPGGFAGANGDDLMLQVEGRIEAALQAGQGIDADLLLLALHAKIVQPSVIEQFQLESASG